MASKKRKKKNRKKKNSKLGKIIGILIFLSLALYMVVFKTGFFNVKTIEVEGNKFSKKEDIIKQSGFKKDFNIYNFNLDEAVENIKTIPYTKSVNVRRKLPNKILIEVEEREMTALTQYMGEYAYIDEEGRVLYIGKKLVKKNLPELFGLELDNLKEGQYIFTAKTRDEEALLKAIRSEKLVGQIKYINMYDLENLVLELNTGEKIMLGSIDNLGYKLEFMKKILKDTKSKKQKVKQISFTKGSNPIVVTE